MHPKITVAEAAVAEAAEAEAEAAVAAVKVEVAIEAVIEAVIKTANLINQNCVVRASRNIKTATNISLRNYSARIM